MQVGLMGAGLMGYPMAKRLAEQGVSLTVYNRTRSKVESLHEVGVAIAPSPSALLAACECIILMVTHQSAIADLLLTPNVPLQGKTIIQMGTIGPQESLELKTQIEAIGGSYLEAPVLGSIPEAKTGKLLVMVGATQTQFEQWQPLLAHFGEQPQYFGEVGQASATKLALNHLIAGLTATFGLSLRFVQHYAVDMDAFMQLLRQSALYAPTFDKKLDRMLHHHYDNPNFPTKHLLKDVNLFAEETDHVGLFNPTVQGMQALLERAIALGLAEQDYSALIEATQQSAIAN